MPSNPFIALENVTVRVGDKWLLHHTHWRINQGEHWVIWGPNGAGKTTLANVLLGHLAVVRGKVHRFYEQTMTDGDGRQAMALVSPEQVHGLHRREQLLDEMRHFSGRLDEQTLAGQMLGGDSDMGCPAGGSRPRTKIRQILDLAPLLKKPVGALSSGEMRKLLLGRALMANPHLLILDEPFNGLDASSRQALMGILGQLKDNTQMVLITHRLWEIPVFFSMVICLQQGRTVWHGTRKDFLQGLHEAEAEDSQHMDAQRVQQPPPAFGQYLQPTIQMRDVTVRYDHQVVLNRIDWIVRQGENWALIGPNGAGKSTLLRLITGDNLQSYANDLILFGKPKGAGESVWEIKARIGYVGDDLQIRYQRKMTGFDVVCSGFFDSVGLYRHCTGQQRQVARHWIEKLGLDDLDDQIFTRLSFGQQRLLLIARAMVKSPMLLILDEPCNGLDPAHRRRLMQILDLIGGSGSVNLLYVSHRAEEMPSCITHRLELEAGRVRQITTGRLRISD